MFSLIITILCLVLTCMVAIAAQVRAQTAAPKRETDYDATPYRFAHLV